MATRGLYLLLGPASALGVGRFAYALVLPLMQEAWGLSYAQGGLLGSANTLGYLLGALSSHHLLLRLGYRRGFFLALFLQALALSLTGALGFPLAFALRLLQGFLGALSLWAERPSSWPQGARARSWGSTTAGWAWAFS